MSGPIDYIIGEAGKEVMRTIEQEGSNKTKKELLEAPLLELKLGWL